MTVVHFMAQCLCVELRIKGLIRRFKPREKRMELYIYSSSARQGVSELRQKSVLYIKAAYGERAGRFRAPLAVDGKHVDNMDLFVWMRPRLSPPNFLLPPSLNSTLSLIMKVTISFLPLFQLLDFSPKCLR